MIALFFDVSSGGASRFGAVTLILAGTTVAALRRQGKTS